MARTLYLFKKIHPNSGNNTHYFGTGAQMLAALMATSDYVGSFAENSYRIETDHVKLQAQMGNYNKITYIIDADSESGYFKAYHVKNNKVVSGFVDFSITPDLWGTNIENATFNRIHVARCNRNIGNGRYDDARMSFINGSTNYETILSDSPRIAYGEGWNVYFLVEMQIGNNMWGNEPVSQLRIYSIPVKAIIEYFEDVQEDEQTNPDHISPIGTFLPLNSIAAIIGGIYAADDTPETKARVKSAFIAPDHLTPIPNDQETEEFLYQSFKSTANGIMTITLKAVLCQPSVYKFAFKFSALGTTAANPNYECYIGAGYRVTKLRRCTNGDEYFQILYQMGYEGLSVTLRQGSDEYDLSEAFRIPLTAEAVQMSDLQKISFAIGMATEQLNVAKGFVKSGGSAMGAFDAATSEANIVGKYLGQDRQPASIGNVGGDGLITFGMKTPPVLSVTENLVTDISAPFNLIVFESYEDEQYHARYEGANFDKYISNFSISDALLGYGSMTDTYIVCDSLEIEGLQEDAESFVRSELARGIYYVYL